MFISLLFIWPLPAVGFTMKSMVLFIKPVLLAAFIANSESVQSSALIASAFPCRLRARAPGRARPVSKLCYFFNSPLRNVKKI
jgi:hypothetical protein